MILFWVNTNLGPTGGAPPYTYQWLVNGYDLGFADASWIILTYADIATIPDYVDSLPDTTPITLTVTDTAGTSITQEINAFTSFNFSNNL